MFAAPVQRIDFSANDELARYASSEWAERGFCRACGTSLFYFLKPSGTYMVSVGAFDDAAVFELAREIFIDAKPPGYAFAGDRPRLTEAEVLAAFSA